jgi:hypothetical protein
MLEDALEITIDLDKKIDLVVQLGKLRIAKVSFLSFSSIVSILVLVGAIA